MATIANLSEKEEIITSLDLKAIGKKIQAKLDWTDKQRNKALVDYKNFLRLILRYPQISAVPTSSIDEVWHAHILDTQRYHADCDTIFGYYLHHKPSYDDAEKETLHTDFNNMVILWKKEFAGKPFLTKGE